MYFLSETIHAQENGSRGTHFADSNLFKGLTYSALDNTLLDFAYMKMSTDIKFIKVRSYFSLLDSAQTQRQQIQFTRLP